MAGNRTGEARQQRAPLSGTLRFALLVLLVLLAVAALSGLSRYLAFSPQEGATGAMRVRWPLWRSFLMSMGQWGALIPSFFLLWWIVRRSPLDRTHWRSTILRHLGGMVLYAPLQYGFSTGIYVLLVTGLGSWGEAREILAQIPLRQHGANLIQFLFQYGGTASLLYVWDYYRREREKRQRTLVLERQLSQAQLRMLRMQLSPHFLFNTLNAVTTLMRRDVDAAEQMVLALTAFLRSTLEEDGALESPLGRELELARRYFDIEAIRFPGRLALEVRVEPALLGAMVPSLMLQPLVENAIRHGLAPRAAGGRILVRAEAEGACLTVAVEDDGIGVSRGDGRNGLGLANTKERLVQLYGAAASLEAGPGVAGGFRVAAILPLAFERTKP